MHSTEVLKCFKFPPLNLVLWACPDEFENADEFLATVSDGVVHCVIKVVIQSIFGFNTAT